jgi:hypothetical protein
MNALFNNNFPSFLPSFCPMLSVSFSVNRCGGVGGGRGRNTGWPPAMLPGPSKRSQPYDQKTRGNIYWPKYKGPRHVLGIFKPCFGQICALYSLFKVILLPPNLLGKF